MTAFDNFFA